MKRTGIVGSWTSVFVIASLVGCATGTNDTGEPVALPPPETFAWSGQPIAFSPPPEGWQREREQSGGLFGARFVLSGGGGQRIHVAVHSALERRDRCEALRELRERFPKLDDRGFRVAIQEARFHVPKPINASELRGSEEANAKLDFASRAWFDGDRVGAQNWAGLAGADAARIRYELDDVVDRVTYAPGTPPAWIEIEVGPRAPATVAGEPAYVLDYSLVDSGRAYVGREYYVLHNNRLFVASFQGFENNLDLFERIVASISFPSGDCEHGP